VGRGASGRDEAATRVDVPSDYLWRHDVEAVQRKPEIWQKGVENAVQRYRTPTILANDVMALRGIKRSSNQVAAARSANCE
jgi:hypothetical protein